MKAKHMETNHNQTTKILACVAAVTVLCGSSAVLAFAAGTQHVTQPVTTEKPLETTTAVTETVAQKDETVYVLAGADGAVQKVIVSDWIQNKLGVDILTDASDVTDPQNVKSDAGYTLDTDNARVWDAQGNDIYYQGTIDKALPVDLSIRYTLDGAAISAADLAGKSGKVTMRFDYTNKQYETVLIDGVKTDIYVPFLMLTGTILDNEVFRNVTVSNGKLINDGDRTVVMGFAMPGLQQNLGLDTDKLTIPDCVEITADVTNFELTTTLTLATNELFNTLDTGKLDEVDKLTGQLNELTGAMDQLMDGSSKLYTNLKTLTEKSKTLIASIDQLADGAKTLADKSYELANGAEKAESGAQAVADGSEQVRAKMAQLSAGLATITANSGDLRDGAAQVFGTLLDTVNTQITAAGLPVAVPTLTIENYAATLDAVTNSLSGDNAAALAEQIVKAQVMAKVEANMEQIRAGAKQQTEEKVLAGVLATQSMTVAQYQQAVTAGAVDEVTQQAIAAAVNARMETAEVQAQMEAGIEKTVTDLIAQGLQSDEAKVGREQALQELAAGAQSLTAAKTQLDSFNTFYQGVLAYTGGTDKASDGATQLAAGVGALQDGAAELATGTATLSDGAQQLAAAVDTLSGYMNELKSQSAALPDGAQQLTDGAMQLSNGLKELNEKGVQKLTEAVNGDLTGLITRLRVTADVSKNYRSFAGVGDSMDSTVRFIYRTDAIEAQV